MHQSVPTQQVQPLQQEATATYFLGPKVARTRSKSYVGVCVPNKLGCKGKGAIHIYAEMD